MDNLFDYRRGLDALQFTPEQKKALTAQVVRTAAGETAAPRRRPMRRTLVLAAAAALVLALGVGAGATVLKLASVSFAPIFGTAQTEIIDKIGRPIDASCTDNGVTITADAIIGDKYNACIVYSITNADGSPLTLPEGVEYVHFASSDTALRSTGGQHGSSWSVTDPETGHLQYVQTISANEPLKLGATKATFRDLTYFDEETQTAKTLLEGDWTLKFDVDYEDSAIVLSAGQTFTNDGVGFTIDSISLSPVAIQVRYTADRAPDWGDDQESGRMPPAMAQEEARFQSGISMLVTLADGSTLDFSDSAGGSISPTKHGADCTKSTVFEQILPLEDVVSVTFGDVVFPVDAK